tara:strand:+ start:46 stop:531 length:486 start_codon:yes stop_codon:yes gene_type:complete
MIQINKLNKGANMNQNKIPFNKVDQSILQDIAGQLVSNHVRSCQSMLVHELMEKEILYPDHYENLFMSDERIKEYHNVSTDEEVEEIRNNGSDINEVYEHWLVSDWLLDKLREQEEPILETDYETWWGRTCSGQAILLDHNIQELAYQYSLDERLFKKEVA